MERKTENYVFSQIDNWKIYHRPVLAVYLKDLMQNMHKYLISSFFCIEIYAHCLFFYCFNPFFILSLSANLFLRFLFKDWRFFYFHSLTKIIFLVKKELVCQYDKQNNTWLLADMKFLFSCAARHLTRSLCSLVSYRVEHSKRNSISTYAHVLFSLSVKVHFALLVAVFL